MCLTLTKDQRERITKEDISAQGKLSQHPEGFFDVFGSLLDELI